MEEHNSPRKTRSGKLLGNVTQRVEEGGRGDNGEEMPPVDDNLMFNEEVLMDGVPAVQDAARGETDVIDLTHDYIVEDIAGDRTITIVDDEDTTDVTDNANGDNELGEDRAHGNVLDVTVDLTDSPLTSSSSTVFKLPGMSSLGRIFGFTSTSTSGASLLSTSGASMPFTSASIGSIPSTSASIGSMPSTSASMPSTSATSTSGDSSPSTAPSNASSVVTCRICLDSQSDLEKDGHNLLSTVCGHIFCSKCLPSYIKKKGLCPICRKVLKPKDFHQIFL